MPGSLDGSPGDSMTHLERTTSARLHAALDWIQQAQRATNDEGISKGYHLLRRAWAPSYPETTGYTIPTLLNAAERLGRTDLHSQSLSLANYLLNCMTTEGGVIHWQAKASSQPIVFDTGQVVFGLLAAYDFSGKQIYLEAAQRAGNWLCAIQNEAGYWERNQHLDRVKVIDARVAWALLELHQRTGVEPYREAAVRNLDWACIQQNDHGWFNNCAFQENQDPLTHTLAYTAEGLLECGICLGEGRYIASAQKMLEALLRKQRKDGALASTYRSDWQESSRSSCLTGNCQIALLWLTLYERSGEQRFHAAAHKAINFVASRQNLQTKNPNIRGGIPGSAPVYGHYERFKLPNWAAKFYIDSLIALDKIQGQPASAHFVG
ncbi:MAG: hypothetical protein M5U05_00040 [Anaerolineales bacterium]|nr:hypothetical protein [Anaerolineales bacterium]